MAQERHGVPFVRPASQENSMSRLLAAAAFAAMCAITVATAIDRPFTEATAASTVASATIDVYKDAN